MATKEAVAVLVESRAVWDKYISTVGEAHITKVYKTPTNFPVIVIERLTDGWCGTAEAQIFSTGHYDFDRWASARTDNKLYNAVKRWDLDVPVAVENWPMHGSLKEALVSA